MWQDLNPNYVLLYVMTSSVYPAPLYVLLQAALTHPAYICTTSDIITCTLFTNVLFAIPAILYPGNRDGHCFLNEWNFLRTNQICFVIRLSFRKKKLNGSFREKKRKDFLTFFLNYLFLMYEQFYWTNDFSDRMILLIELFYFTIFQWENERNKWKINDNFENERKGSLSNNERTK